MTQVDLRKSSEADVPLFTLESTDGKARAGTLHTAHGDISTPTFMPVATQGSVKALDAADLNGIRARMLLANTYHLYLRPGVEIVQMFGGLHGFMGWTGPILTDSGGFQGFSLENLREITDDGIVFKSHIDGSFHTFNPESVIAYQRGLGADIIMPLDVCVPVLRDVEAVDKGVEMTTRWAARSLEAHLGKDQILFGIVQGGLFKKLRERSAAAITAMRFPGYGIGGLSVGESKFEMYELTDYTADLLPTDTPRHLLGVGSPEDLVECVARGIDMFDCVLPTRIARNGALFVNGGRINVDAAPYKTQESPVDSGCDCYTCVNHSTAYLHHLFRARELLAYRLATIHNLRFVLRLMEEMRAAIRKGCFESYRREFLGSFVPADEQTRLEQKRRWRRRGYGAKG